MCFLASLAAGRCPLVQLHRCSDAGSRVKAINLSSHLPYQTKGLYLQKTYLFSLAVSVGLATYCTEVTNTFFTMLPREVLYLSRFTVLR